MNNYLKIIKVNGDKFECNVDPIQIPIIERMLRGVTKSDETIQALTIPNRPIWLYIVVKFIRLYRKIISSRLGNRCVFEPSCSHYAELAFRNYGFIKGFWLTLNRLSRCRPGAGGIDMP